MLIRRPGRGPPLGLPELKEWTIVVAPPLGSNAMSKVSLAALASTNGAIHVHVDVAPGPAYGISFPASELMANLSSFERLFAVSPSSRRERSGHRWTMARLLKACEAAPSENLAAAAQTMFEQAFANGCVWDAVNDPADPEGARRKVFGRLKLGVPAHIRAIVDSKGQLRTRILDGEPGDADDVEWIVAMQVVRPDSGPFLPSSGWVAALPAIRG